MRSLRDSSGFAALVAAVGLLPLVLCGAGPENIAALPDYTPDANCNRAAIPDVYKWNLEPARLLVAGDSGNDADMLSGDALGVVVANHTVELEELRGHPRIYFADGAHAWGVIEGIEHYDFFGRIRVPETNGDDVEEGRAVTRGA